MELTIGARSLRSLVDPVLPCAAADDMLPVLCTVRIESRGQYLVAIATDRYRLAMKRLAAPSGEAWPEWSATVPVSTIKSILATFKPSARDADPMLTLIIGEDGGTVRVLGEGGLLDFAEAAIAYPLLRGDYPKTQKLFREAISDEVGSSHVALNPALIAGVLPKGVPAACVKVSSPVKPILITDGEDFISILMPRRLSGGKFAKDAVDPFPSLDSWSDLLADEPAKAEAVA
jgi:DNA polymerase III sliding clamp (beta) subunit (PCNA family)